MNKKRSKKVGLALGAGGARGFAHIGALRAIEEAGLEPAACAGSSMGAVVGAMIAAGHDSEHITQLLTDRKRLTFPGPGGRGGLFGHEKIIDAFCDELPERIESLSVPFVAIAVDITKGEVVVLDRGDLRTALSATVALPGILRPVAVGGRQLVDGAVINGLPVDVVSKMTDDRVLAIDVTSARDRELTFERRGSWWHHALDRLLLRRRPLAVDVFLKAFAIQQSLLTDERLRRHPPDVHVRVDLDPALRLEDFGRHREAIAAGYQSTRAALRKET